MGYRPPTTGQKLDFTGTPYEGLEVTVDSTSMRAALDITELFVTASERTNKEAVKALRELLAEFAEVLEDWNVDHPKTGEPVPVTHAGLLSLEDRFVMAIIEAWLTGTTGAGDELGKDSPSGATLPEVPIPMEPLSSSPPS